MVLLLLALLAACGDNDVDVGAGGPASVSTTVAGASTTALEGGTTSPVSVPSSASGIAYLLHVRLAGQPGFDRLVFEFQGDDLPGYDIAYVEPPIREDASGNPVTVDGEAFLQVRMEPASGVDLRGEEVVEIYQGPKRVSASGTHVVDEVVETGDFEANLTWVVGLGERVPFRVDTLSSPPRLVVELAASAGD
jgi:hypothetical protein